jgi:P-type E1-E2 ATPase
MTVQLIQRLLGCLRLADRVRPEAGEAVEALGKMGIRSVLLTGDTRPICVGHWSDLARR